MAPIAPTFLELDEVLLIHRNQIELYGGMDGVRDLGLLQSAIAMPKAMFSGEFLHQGLIEMAAAYLFHLISNHPFIDGNKRTAAVAAIVFLALNGIETDVDEARFEALVRSAAQGKKTKQQIADFLHKALIV